MKTFITFIQPFNSRSLTIGEIAVRGGLQLKKIVQEVITKNKRQN